MKLTDDSGRYSLTFYGQNITKHQWLAWVLTVPGQVAPFFITLDGKSAVYGVTFGARF
jgi:hypothetical protein